MTWNEGKPFAKDFSGIVMHARCKSLGKFYKVLRSHSFSAAIVSAIYFKNETAATIIGEPPGEKPNSYSENDEMKLPNSGLVVSYSTKYYKFLPEDVPAFAPHIRVDPDWKNYVAVVFL